LKAIESEIPNEVEKDLKKAGESLLNEGK